MNSQCHLIVSIYVHVLYHMCRDSSRTFFLSFAVVYCYERQRTAL